MAATLGPEWCLEETDALWDSIAAHVGRLEDLEPRMNTNAGQPPLPPLPEWTVTLQTKKVTIPPVRPLTLDVLLYVLDSSWPLMDFPLLNAIRRTCRAVNRLSDRYLVLRHNDFYFHGHRRFARFCMLVLRQPTRLLPLLKVLRIGDIHPDRGEMPGEVFESCICTELLVKVVQQSTALTNIEFKFAEAVVAVDPQLGPALSALSSLRELTLDGGVGPETRDMLTRLRPGLRKLTVSFEGYYLPGPLLVTLFSIRDSLKELDVSSIGEPLRAFDYEDETDMVQWPAMCAVYFRDVLVVSKSQLLRCFPNLHHLEMSNYRERGHQNADQIRKEAEPEGLCWPALDIVSLNGEWLWMMGLRCTVRCLKVPDLYSPQDAERLLEDLPFLQPVVLTLDLYPPAWANFTGSVEPSFSGVSAAMVTRMLQPLSRTKALALTIHDLQGTASVAEVDAYLECLAVDIRLSTLQFLQLNLSTLSVIDEETEETFSEPVNHGRATKRRRSHYMADEAQLILVRSFAPANPRLRYVCINSWTDRSFWSPSSSKGTFYWEIVPAEGAAENSGSLAVRALSREQGRYLWDHFQCIDA